MSRLTGPISIALAVLGLVSGVRDWTKDRLKRGALEASPLDDSTSLSLAPCALFFSVADCEVTISWGDESTCGIFAFQSDQWLGGVLQLSDLAELAEPAVACNPLDNPKSPNVASSLPEEGYGWVAGPYSPPDSQGQRFRAVECMDHYGAVVNDTFCIDPSIPEDELWRPADRTTSLPLTGKVALIARGVCTIINKGAVSRGAKRRSSARIPEVEPIRVPQVKRPSWPVRRRHLWSMEMIPSLGNPAICACMLMHRRSESRSSRFQNLPAAR